MARRNYIQELEYQNAQGMDTTSSLPNILPGFVAEAYNTNITDDGTYEKRDGYRIRCHQSSDWDDLAYNIRNGIRFKPRSGGARTIVYGEGVNGGAVGLAVRPSDPVSLIDILEDAPGLQFTQTFTSDSGFVYDSDLAEFVTSPTTRVEQIQQGVNPDQSFFIDFEDNDLIAEVATGDANPLFSSGVTVVTYAASQRAQVGLSGSLQYAAFGNVETPEYIDYSADIIIRQMNGTLTIFYLEHGAGSTQITYTHSTTTWSITSSQSIGGVPNAFLLSDTFNHALVADSEFNLKILRDAANGIFQIKIDNSIVYTNNFSPFIAGPAGMNPGDRLRLNGNTSGTVSDANSVYYDNVTFISENIPFYSENKVDLPAFLYSGLGDIQAFTGFTATEVGSPRYIVEGNYWNGANWVTSDGSYTQANTQAEVDANIGSFSPPLDNQLEMSIVFPDGSTQSAVSEVQVEYTGQTEVASENLDCIETIKGGLTTLRAYFVTSRGLLFVYNGETPFLYDGVETRQIGITAPSGTVAGTANAGSGSLNSSASYVLAVTYYNPTTGAESSPIVSEPIALGASDNEILATFPAGDLNTASITRIYRSVANGNTLFLDSEVAVTETSLTITKADRDLETLQLELDNSRITDFTSTPNYPALINNRVFVKTGFNEIRFSKVGQSGAMPESFEVKSLVTTEGSHGANDDIVGIGKINTLPIIIKERSIGRLAEAGVPDTGISSDLVTYIYQEISNVVGGVGHAAGCQVFDEYVFLGRDDIYATNGVTVRSVGEKISDTIKTFNFKDGNAEKLSAINDTKNKRIYITVISEQSNEPDWVLVGDYRQYPKFRWTMYRPAQTGFCSNGFATGPSTHPGIAAGCFWEELNEDTGAPDIFFGNLRANSQYYRMNVGEADEVELDEVGDPVEKGIWFRVTSRPYSFNEPLIEKLFKDTEFFAVAKDKDHKLHVSSLYDLSDYASGNWYFSLPTVGSIWSDNQATLVENEPNGEWADNMAAGDNDAIWAGEILSRLNYDPHRKARFYQVRFSQIQAHAPITLYGWGVQASFMRPR